MSDLDARALARAAEVLGVPPDTPGLSDSSTFAWARFSLAVEDLLGPVVAAFDRVARALQRRT